MKSNVETSMDYPLENGGSTRIDLADLHFLTGRSWRWIGAGRKKRRYVVAHDCADGKQERIYLHRLLLRVHGIKSNPVDHIDGDSLNNTRANLRLATAAQNSQNVPILPGRYRGVFSQHGKFIARAGKYYAGCFSTPDHAAIAYDAAARRIYGPLAAVNFEASNDAAY